MERPHLKKEKDYSLFSELFTHHIESFDYMIDQGLETMLMAIKPVEVSHQASGSKLRNILFCILVLWFGKPELFPPEKERGYKGLNDPLYPFECRQAKLSYTGKFVVDICLQFDDGAVVREKFNLGQFPIMLKSKLCRLRTADNSQKLVRLKEEPSEMGGYFILNGLERVVRLLILPKRNYPMSLVRNSFRDKREGYTDKAVVIRCVREDQSAVSIRLYYLINGSARLGFWIQGREYLLPVGVILKALVDTTDRDIYVSLTCVYNEIYDKAKGAVGTQLFGERASIILHEVTSLSLFTRRQCLQHIGEHFQPVMSGMEEETYSAVAEAVLRDYIFVHLDNNHDKFNLLIFMLQKLFSLIDQTSVLDNPDSLQNQEVLLPGHLITIYLKEKLEDWLLRTKQSLKDQIASKAENFQFILADVKKVFEKNGPRQITLAIENMLKTGRLATQSGLDLQQRAGMTVQAERINFLRFISHFRAVHRGSALAGLRTTSVRKLLPESWGFLCPVHTPDGELCGLLNHLAAACRITSYYDSKGNIKDFRRMRMSIIDVLNNICFMKSAMPKLPKAGPPELLTVLLDGRVVGYVPLDLVEKAITHLRRLKLSTVSPIPFDLEVGYIPLSMGGAYPGIYLFTSPSRFIRPVRNISVPPQDDNDIELIEIHPKNMLSVVGNLTPWSDHNQSPRNMYQCQMAKQTMGFPSLAINCRADQKLYHLQTPQTPIVRTGAYEKYCIDDYPLGTNAIVAVLAYSGYDMEDAMVLNKSSVDRGMCHGHVYQTETVDLAEQSAKSDRVQKMFKRSYNKKNPQHLIDRLIDSDGLPYVGQKINPNEPYCSVYSDITTNSQTITLKGTESVIVDYVAVDTKTKSNIQKANIRFRRSRNPIIGDKFSSRHGQKGVCSQLWPDIDMPFSAVTGMRPDLIINPHAFPSRMTIGMLLESIAAKGGALHGKFVDATPFSTIVENDTGSNSDSDSLVDDLGSMLRARGFNYHGVEVLYSGFYGTELTCEIFIGPVYYQRLRHMVSDKFQVRSTGRVDQVTRQPIKGRKYGGGIRFGEMERDSLLAHGAAYLLHDRLHTSSDHHIADVCSLCGSILTSTLIQPPQKIQEIAGLPPAREPKKIVCVACKTSKGMETVSMPYVFKYLAAELAAMNIKMDLKLSNVAGA
ncbi:unnamed protein product [Cuscuta campestris]|uniref:DNA-directed RNA polymerase subunit beta n=1 Tax=Cuscuta campestris TaxID=132261 RepID=A0A484MRL7_9ASTE|nr:unnamed protein product [Cuscuta campestris]